MRGGENFPQKIVAKKKTAKGRSFRKEKVGSFEGAVWGLGFANVFELGDTWDDPPLSFLFPYYRNIKKNGEWAVGVFNNTRVTRWSIRHKGDSLGRLRTLRNNKRKADKIPTVKGVPRSLGRLSKS